MIDEHDGIVDKFVGDSAVALFIPGFAGSRPCGERDCRGRDLLEKTGNGGPESWIPIGAGIHTGTSFVGTVGEGDAGISRRLAHGQHGARLSGLAGAGEILIGAEAAAAAGFETAETERRTLELRGKEQVVDAWVATARSRGRVVAPM